jgi:hypothetical protein
MNRELQNCHPLNARHLTHGEGPMSLKTRRIYTSQSVVFALHSGPTHVMNGHAKETHDQLPPHPL